MKIIISGGGTGGHIIPNIALLDELKLQIKDLEVLYIGSKNGMEAQMIPNKGWKYQAISCGKLRRYFSWENLMDIFRTTFGIVESLRIIFKFKPTVIFCKGGYVSLPVAIAGGILRKPVIIHESDVVPGLANKIAAHFAKVICVSFEKTAIDWQDKRVVVTGNPVRKELANGSAVKGFEYTNLKTGNPVILIMGGSQGAEFINKLIWLNLKKLLIDFQIIHICGKGKERADLKKVFDGYFSAEYIGEELKDIYAITDLIITRSGANSLAEIEFLNKPAILIPLVVGSRGDQIGNAEVFAKEQVAAILDESKNDKLEEIDLMGIIKNLLSRKKAEAKMPKHNLARGERKSAVVKIVSIIKSYENKDEKKL